jgi:hypothetical protein
VKFRAKFLFRPADWWVGVLPLAVESVHAHSQFGPGRCADAIVYRFVVSPLPMVQFLCLWRSRWHPAVRQEIQMTVDASKAQMAIASLLAGASFIVLDQPPKRRQSEPGVN